MGAADFRVGGRIFATLASVKQGYGNLMLTPELQAEFIAGRPDLFLPVHGGWGRNGATHIRLADADEDTLARRVARSLEAARGKESGGGQNHAHQHAKLGGTLKFCKSHP